jgi:hypothetical protein
MAQALPSARQLGRGSDLAPSKICLRSLTQGARSEGTKPHDASVTQHEAMAQQEETAAAGHADQHGPNAKSATETCSGKGGRWTSVSNPTA